MLELYMDAGSGSENSSGSTWRTWICGRAGCGCEEKGTRNGRCPSSQAAIAAVEKYLAVRTPLPGERALFLNSRGARLGDREVRRLVKRYALLGGRGFGRSPAQFPPCLCDSPSGGRGRSPGHPGTAGPRPAFEYAEVHASSRSKTCSVCTTNHILRLRESELGEDGLTGRIGQETQKASALRAWFELEATIPAF